MRYRRFGRSELEVSEVGFGMWTLAGDGWGQVEDQRGMVHAALDAGINFIDTAPVHRDGDPSEELLRTVLTTLRDEIILASTYDHDVEADRGDPGRSERPPARRPELVRTELEGTLRRLRIDHIDLFQLHTPRIEPILADDLWAELESLRVAGKVRELGIALGPAARGVEVGCTAIRDRDIVSLQTVFNILEQEPGLTFAAEGNVADGRVGLVARVPHASGALSGKITRDTVLPSDDHRAHRDRDDMLDDLDRADSLAVLWDGTGRTPGQAAIAGILANPAFTTVLPTCLDADEVREYAGASDLPLTDDEAAYLDSQWHANFGITSRRAMPLKSSV